MRQKPRFLGALLLLCLLLSISACRTAAETEGSSPPARPLPQDPFIGTEISEDQIQDGQTTVTLYRRLGSNEPTKIKTLLCDGETYTLCNDSQAMQDFWGMSEKLYAYIGWFNMDENGEPGNFAGAKEVKLKAGENLPLIAVFNTRGSYQASTLMIQLYYKEGTKKANFSSVHTGMNQYQLPEDVTEEMKQWNLDPGRYSFQGWYFADLDGEPRKPVEDLNVTLEPGIGLFVTAVFQDKKTGAVAALPEQ